MPYFKDSKNEVHFLSDSDIANGGKNLLPIGCVQISEGESAILLAPPAPTLKEAQSNQSDLLDSAYSDAIQQNITYLGSVFQADNSSQDTLIKALTVFAGTVPAGFYWVDFNNNKVPMTFVQLQGLAQAMMARGWASFQKLTDLKEQIIKATTIDQVNLIVWG